MILGLLYTFQANAIALNWSEHIHWAGVFFLLDRSSEILLESD